MSKSNKYMIAALREQHHISQEELAKKLNINRALLSQIETGLVLPNFDMLIEIARIFDCLVTDLYNKKDLETIK
jgi:DNA-binding XRE family transcriptional regulator